MIVEFLEIAKNLRVKIEILKLFSFVEKRVFLVLFVVDFFFDFAENL